MHLAPLGRGGTDTTRCAAIRSGEILNRFSVSRHRGIPLVPLGSDSVRRHLAMGGQLIWGQSYQLSHHRRCRPAGDETEFDSVSVVEFLGVSRHRGRSFLGASEPVVESDPEPLSTPDYATGWQQPRSTLVRFPWIEVPSLRRVRRSDGSFARALCRSGYS